LVKRLFLKALGRWKQRRQGLAMKPEERIDSTPPAAPAVAPGCPPPDERPPGTRKKGSPDHVETGRVSRAPKRR